MLRKMETAIAKNCHVCGNNQNFIERFPHISKLV
jgi:hypothetical protein